MLEECCRSSRKSSIFGNKNVCGSGALASCLGDCAPSSGAVEGNRPEKGRKSLFPCINMFSYLDEEYIIIIKLQNLGMSFFF